MARYDILNGYQTCDQVNQNVAQTVKMTVRAPRIANRIFDTYQHALDYVNISDDTATAVVGLILSVFNDTPDKNGIYRVTKVKTSHEDTDGSIEPIGKCDCGIDIIHVDNLYSDLAGYLDEDIHFCILDGNDEQASEPFIFTIDSMQGQMLQTGDRYGTRKYNGTTWSEWEWHYYVDNYHTHVSSDITDSVSHLPVEQRDMDKLVQAGAVMQYIGTVLPGPTIPVEDHKLIYSEDNQTLVAREFMMRKLYVVDKEEDVEKCKSQVDPHTASNDILKEWRQFSNSHNMPELGGGVSWLDTEYKPVGYQQGYGKWVYNQDNGSIQTTVTSSEITGYMSPNGLHDISIESVIGCVDNSSTKKKEGYDRGLWLIGKANGVSLGEVKHIGIKVATIKENKEDGVIIRSDIQLYRDTLYDREGSATEPWRAWVGKDETHTYVLYGISEDINKVRYKGE